MPEWAKIQKADYKIGLSTKKSNFLAVMADMFKILADKADIYQ